MSDEEILHEKYLKQLFYDHVQHLAFIVAGIFLAISTFWLVLPTSKLKRPDDDDRVLHTIIEFIFSCERNAQHAGVHTSLT